MCGPYKLEVAFSQVNCNGFSQFFPSKFSSEGSPLILTSVFTPIKASLYFLGCNSSTQSVIFSVPCGPDATLFLRQASYRSSSGLAKLDPGSVKLVNSQFLCLTVTLLGHLFRVWI